MKRLIKQLVVVAVIAGTCLTAAAAEAERSVYLNGARIDGVTEQTIRGADIRFDSMGNVHIKATGYRVQPQGDGTMVPSAPKLASRYWLFSSKAKPGATGYEVEIFINGHFVRKVRSHDAQVIQEVSGYLQPGKNIIHFKAAKDAKRPETSKSPADFFKLIVGVGDTKGEQLVIQRTLVEYRRTAKETGSFDDEYTFAAK